MPVHSIGDLTQLQSGDTLGPKNNECTQIPTTESLELLCLILNRQQCKSSCAFPHVTAQGLKARTTPWSTVTRAVSQDVCVFLLICRNYYSGKN